MTSDTERSRQRTVAELLAEHGDAAASSRRRRRRSVDDEPVEPSQAPDARVAPPIVTQRTSSPVYPATDLAVRPHFEPGDRDRREAYRAVSRPEAPAPPHPPVVPPPNAARWATAPAAARPVEFPTEVMGQVAASPTGFDPEVTGPISVVRAPEQGPPHAQPVAPAVAAPSGAAQPVTPADGGPPTQYSPGVVEEESDDAESAEGEWADDEWADEDWSDDEWAEDGEAEAADQTDDEVDDGEYEAEHDGGEYDDELEDGEVAGSRRRGAARPGSRGPAWPAVIAQWIAGAIGGAALWVGFRYLWKGFPVVAVAAALAVTIGLVVIVRTLLRNNDLRTTLFAVLVGLLLTASPAVLVLIGR